jgi:hypothetical protein
MTEGLDEGEYDTIFSWPGNILRVEPHVDPADAVVPMILSASAEDLAQVRHMSFDMPHKRVPRHHGDRRGIDTTGMDPAIAAELKKMGTRPSKTPEQVRQAQQERDRLAMKILRDVKADHAATDPFYRQVAAVMARQTPGLLTIPTRVRHRGGSLPGPVPGSSLPTWLRWTIWAYAFPITVMVALLALTWLGARYFVRRMNAAAARLPD